MAITLRGEKNSPLTHTELDQNFREFFNSSSVEGDSVKLYKYLNSGSNTLSLTLPTTGSVNSLTETSNILQRDVEVVRSSVRSLENTINSLNVNQEGQSTLSGVDSLTFPSSSANIGTQLQVFGQSANNLVVNGDFRNGTGSWSSQSSTNTVSGSVLLNTGNGTEQEAYVFQNIGAKTVGNKYYTCAVVRVTSNLCNRLSFDNGDGQFFTTVNSPTLNTWYSMCSITTAASTVPFILIRHRYVDAATANGKVMEVQKVLSINLTATFGAGNEPSLGECNLLFNNYFEGEGNVLGTGRFTSMESGSVNKTSLYLNGGVLRSSGSTRDEIRKGENGYELVRRVDPASGAILSTPTSSSIPHTGLLTSYPSGTLTFEPLLADAGVYSTSISIQDTDYPISSLERIVKRVNGADVELSTTTAVIAGNGLSFTHPNLVSGDLVMFTYAYNKESIGRSMTLTHYDSRFVIADTANSKMYRWKITSTNGVASITLTEV